MKRMIALFFVLVTLFGIKFLNEKTFPCLNFQKLIIISKYSELYDREKVQNGNQFYYTFNQEEGLKALKEINIPKIDGLVYYFDKKIGLDFIKNKINFSYEAKEEIEGMKIFYGYDKSYPDFRFLNGKKINCQIVQNSTNIIVGYPMILCGY